MMDSELQKLIDSTAWRIIELLQANARLSYAEIGRQVGLSTPAVIERIQKMETAGIITGYHAAIDAKKIGVGVLAFIRLQTTTRWYAAVKDLAENCPEIRECYHVTGTDSFVMKIAVESIEALEIFIKRFHGLGETSTSIIMSTVVEGKPVLRYD